MRTIEVRHYLIHISIGDKILNLNLERKKKNTKHIYFITMDLHVPCEHYIEGDDENFLLDDENTSIKKCIQCRKLANLWTNNTESINSFSNTMNMPFTNAVLSIGENNYTPPDHSDILEDSPLLINVIILTFQFNFLLFSVIF